MIPKHQNYIRQLPYYQYSRIFSLEFKFVLHLQSLSTLYKSSHQIIKQKSGTYIIE